MQNFLFDDFLIEPIHEKHAWRICDLMIANTERFKRFFPQTLKQNLTPTLSEYFVKNKVRAFHQKEEYLFVLKALENKTAIGLVYIKEVDWHKKEAELAYCIGYPYTGKGYTTASVQTLSNYAFEVLGLQVLRIIVHKSNIASLRVAKKCGYLWTATLPKTFTPKNEQPLDMELYTLSNER